MAEKKNKPKYTFKELPVYCKILRIVAAVLMCIGAIWLIIAAIVCIDNPYAFGLYFAALGFLIPACAAAIVEFVLEKKWLERRQAQGDVPAQQPVEQKVAEQPKAEEAKAAPSQEAAPAKTVSEPGPAKAEPQGERPLLPKFLSWLIPLVLFVILTLTFLIGGLADLIDSIARIIDYAAETAADEMEAGPFVINIDYMFPYLFTCLGAVLCAIIPLIKMKKSEGVYKINAIFPICLSLATTLFMIGYMIWFGLQGITPGDFIVSRLVLAIITLFISIAGLIVCLVMKNKLVAKIAHAAVYGWLFIYCIIVASRKADFLMSWGDGRLGYVIVPLILSVFIAAYPFLLDLKRSGSTQPAPAKAEQPQQEPQKPAEGTWYCPECGAPNTGKFCVKCGAKKHAE